MEIKLSKQATKTLQKMDKATLKHIRTRLVKLSNDEIESLNIRKLKGYDNHFRMRVGDWRIIYSPEGYILSIIKIAPRGEAYD